MATNGKIPQKLLKNDAVGLLELAAIVAGDGISGGAGTALAVDRKTGGGLKIDTAQLAVEPADFAGVGLEDDGSDNLRLATQGTGIAGGGGTTLSFDTTANLTITGVHTHSPNTMQIVGTPDSANDGVNKAYADALISGQLWKEAAKLATVAALPAGTYDNGASGVGATFTVTALGILTVDGVATVLGDRIAVKDQVAGLQNGIYEVTTEGTAGVAAVLTRTLDADNSPSNELETASIFVTAGTANANKTWVQTATSVTVGTTALVFVQSSGASAAAAGAGLTESGNVFNVGDANKGIQVNANDLEFATAEVLDAGGGLKAGSTPAKIVVEPADFAGVGLEDDGSDNLRLAVQGNGIAGGAGSTLSVDPDSETGGNIQPVSVGANGVGVDIAAIAGTGISVDGSANLRVATQGNGIAGGDGSTLSVLANPTGTPSIAVTASGVEVSPAGLIQGGAAEVDGDKIDIDYAPTNYTEVTGNPVGGVANVAADQLTAHLAGIDAALAGLVASTPRQHALTTEAITGTDTAMASQLTNTPVSAASVVLHYFGVQLEQGVGKDYTVSGKVITWLAATGLAPNQAVSEQLVATYVSSD